LGTAALSSLHHGVERCVPHFSLLESSNQMAHLWLTFQPKPINEFLLLAIGMSDPLVLTQMF
jgi:hypothetical protein